MKKEIEILFELKTSLSQALDMLIHKFGDFIRLETIDTYYYDPLRENLSPKKYGDTLRLTECLRLRKIADKNYITYKNDLFSRDDEWLYSDEHETEIQDCEVMKDIFKNLGLKELITVDNTKYYFENSIYEINVEDVKGLGLFIEIECLYDFDETDVDKAKQSIRNFIKVLGLEIGKELNSGKPELLLNKNISK